MQTNSYNPQRSSRSGSTCTAVRVVVLATAEGAPQLSPGQAGNPMPPLNTLPTLSRRQSMVLMRRNTLSPRQTSSLSRHGSGDEYKPDDAWLLL